MNAASVKKLKVNELKAGTFKIQLPLELTKLNLSTAGKKEDLISRLLAAVSTEEETHTEKPPVSPVKVASPQKSPVSKSPVPKSPQKSPVLAAQPVVVEHPVVFKSDEEKRLERAARFGLAVETKVSMDLPPKPVAKTSPQKTSATSASPTKVSPTNVSPKKVSPTNVSPKKAEALLGVFFKMKFDILGGSRDFEKETRTFWYCKSSNHKWYHLFFSK